MSTVATEAAPGAANEPVPAAIRAIWARRREEVIGRIDAIDDAVAALLQDALDDLTRHAGHRAAHQLAGAAGTFGFALAGRLARELEHALADGAQREAPLLAELARALRAELEDEPDRSPAAAPTARGGATSLLLMTGEAQLSEGVSLEASARGMAVRTAVDCAAAARLVAGERPDIVLLDLDIQGQETDALDLLSDLSAEPDAVPVACLTDAAGFVDRLEVARRGGRAHLPRTLGAEGLIAAVEGLLETRENDPTEVLVVDDDPAMLEVMTSVLSAHGLEVDTLADPLRFWETLEASSPDLVLLDVDMPDVGGIDLCRVIRNDPRWVRLPVLFLSARDDPETIQQIFAAGADDYVTKPLVPAELTTRIANRLERVALYRRLADTDVLTGLATRRASTETIERGLQLAARHDRPLSLAIIDLDEFKAINDRHGHAAGDEVLRRLGTVLRTSFRGEDIAARWGGEEFVVGLYAMSRRNGVQRLAEVLETFREESFEGRDGKRFGVSFSAGVACAPHDGRDLESLHRAADRALYRAKEAGRNRVVSSAGGTRPARG